MNYSCNLNSQAVCKLPLSSLPWNPPTNFMPANKIWNSCTFMFDMAEEF